MTRPWFGILPPPRGQGYCPGEHGDFPTYFAPKPPATTNTFNRAEAARREQAIRDLERLASERVESATELIETLNRFLLAGGEASALRATTYALETRAVAK